MAVKGARGLEARLNAMAAPAMRRAVLGRLADRVVAYAKQGVARRTGTTGRTIRREEVTATHARVVAAGAAPFLESGTGIYGPTGQPIRPKAGRRGRNGRPAALRWAVGPRGSLTLGGRIRSGKKGAGAGFIYRRSVKGMKPQPFMKPAAERAIRESGAGVTIVQTWNGAA